MRFYWPIAKLDREQRMVWGYASTEAEDDQGEVIRREALEAALADYMRFANIREMHQPSAVGVATEAAVDDHGLYLGARIVDAEAWRKVTEGVYKGFSIGGRVTARDPGYLYTIATAGKKLVLTNQFMGYTPTFKATFYTTKTTQGTAAGLALVLNACTASKLSLPTKTDDYEIQEFDFSAFADPTGAIGTLSVNE
jgi:Putative phage serine protease XkdF